MRVLHPALAIALTALLLLNSVRTVNACGPEYHTPIFVFETSPDLPFIEFTNGKIGIVRPTFGRKTLVIAYRYLNGGSFTADEQKDLIAALKGKPPQEDDEHAAIKAWIDERKKFVKEEDQQSSIYAERQQGDGYDFFPNCSTNAFEVALETLKNRAASYGAEDKNVRAWLAAQDTVFTNCSRGSQIPTEAGADSPNWLRKDRDYQIAAAYFYSLNFDEARARFEKIAADYDSPWQEIAPYLVARTLIRQASLEKNEPKKFELYEQAETGVQTLSLGGGKFAKPSAKLLGLIKYHLHPEERVAELGRDLIRGTDENLRQDLIDYTWLLDKFEAQIRKAEDERKKKLNPPEEKAAQVDGLDVSPARTRFERVESGELIGIVLYPKKPDGSPDYSKSTSLDFKHDTPQAEIIRAFEQQLGRPLTEDETEQVKSLHQQALSWRAWRLSPNRKWEAGGLTRHEDYWSDETPLTFDLVPEFLRANELSDWILTMQLDGPHAYEHALAKWRRTDSPAWLIASLVKSKESSPSLQQLMRAAEKINRSDLAYPTIAYHLIRLKIALGRQDEARKILDDVFTWQSASMPVSAQNQFLEQRRQLAVGLNVFLKSAQEKPVAFYLFGIAAKMSDLLGIEKEDWSTEYSAETKEEHDQSVEERYKDLLPWDNRVAFDESTADVFNWHFSARLLADAARSPEVPEYLQRSLMLAAWTRAIILKNDQLALKIAPDVLRFAPEMSSVFAPYMKARTIRDRHHAALYVLLKFPNLSPFLSPMLPTFSTSEELEYYLEEAWWCPLPLTGYTADGKEFPKVVPKPAFLNISQLETARRERLAIAALPDGKSYLGKQVLLWARSAPDDPRLPEALFIATKANESYKYGCDSWSNDEKTRDAAKRVLTQRYPRSSWTAKLSEDEDDKEP